MLRALALCSFLGCGRIDFDPFAPTGDATSSDGSDALATTACGRTQFAPATVTVGGETFRYTSFDNARVNMADVDVRVVDGSGNERGAVRSGSDGVWSISIPTSGRSFVPLVRFKLAGFFDTNVHGDLLLDGDLVASPAVALWTMPHGPLWNATGMANVYGTLATRDPARSTMNIAVRDCSDAVVTGARIQLSPSPERLVYQADDGTLDANLSATTGRFGHAVALNVPPGPIEIRVEKDGAQFAERTIVVAGGTVNDLVVVRQRD